jgi:hypothetical protein
MEKLNNNNAESYQAELEEYKAKKLIYYEYLWTSWLAARNEHDKSLLLIATGAIGLLVTLVTAMGLHYWSYFIVFGISLIALVVAAVSIATSFSVNANYIKFLLAEDDMQAEEEYKRLSNLRL